MPPKKKSGAKKKVVSNRGFATVSIPRKKDPEEEAAELAAAEAAAAAQAGADSSEVANGADHAEGGTDGGAANAGAAVGGPTAAVDEWDEETTEKHELQNLADRIRLGCDKEVSRVVKVRWMREGVATGQNADSRDTGD